MMSTPAWTPHRAASHSLRINILEFGRVAPPILAVVDGRVGNQAALLCTSAVNNAFYAGHDNGRPWQTPRLQHPSLQPSERRYSIEHPMRLPRLAIQIMSFGFVGIVGFLVDASMLAIGLQLGLGLYAGRVLSFLAAVTATWTLNRRYTFRVEGRNRLFHEWARYCVSQLAGAVTNLGMYSLLVFSSAFVATNPTIGVAAGSIAGMGVNFLMARKYAFLSRPH